VEVSERDVEKFEGDVQWAREAIDAHRDSVRLWRRLWVVIGTIQLRSAVMMKYKTLCSHLRKEKLVLEKTSPRSRYLRT